MCLRGVGCCLGFGGQVNDDDDHGGSSARGSVTPTPYQHHANNGLYKAPPYDQQKLPVAAAAVEEAYKASNDARRGHNHNWHAAGAGAGEVGQERAFVRHSGAKGTLQTQPAMNAMVAVDGAAYSYPNYGRVPAAHGQYYQHP